MDFSSKSITATFDLSEGDNGFYIALQDTGTCVTVSRVFVYRKRCAGRQEGLVIYPEAPAPLTDVSVEAMCVPNATATGPNSLALTCNSEGEWSGTPQCQCKAGYHRDGNHCIGELHRQC